MTSKDFTKAKRYRCKTKRFKLFIRFLKKSRSRRNRHQIKHALGTAQSVHLVHSIRLMNDGSWKIY